MYYKTHLALFFKSLFFRQKKDLFLYFFLVFISSVLFACLPLITQIYIRYLYPNKDLSLLIYFSIFFIILFIFKLLIDIWVNKFLNKFLLKLEKNLKELVFSKILNKKKISLEKDLRDLETYTKRYSLFVKNIIFTYYTNIISLLSVFVIMFFFSKDLFKYTAWFFLFFVIYLVLFNYILTKNKKNLDNIYKEKTQSYFSLLQDLKKKNKDSKEYLKQFRVISSFEFEKNLKNKNSLVSLNQTFRASITFFRIIFLCYFGVIIILSNQTIGNLIVGLLYISIFGRSVINILTNFIYLVIAKSAIINIHKKMINY